MTTTAQEWQQIATYNAAQADEITTILGHFENELPEHIAKWLRIEHEYRTEKRIEAEQARKVMAWRFLNYITQTAESKHYGYILTI